MTNTGETLARLAAIPSLSVATEVPLSLHTRFALGGPADIFADTTSPDAFIDALNTARGSGLDYVVIGGGTNLIVSDEGFRGIVLKFSGNCISIDGGRVTVEAGAVLQTLVDCSIARGLQGLETMTGIPGFVGAAVYGNAGAYGHSISERIYSVRFYDVASAARQTTKNDGLPHLIHTFTNAECEFRYRESIFKRRKDWIILSVELDLSAADATALKATADGILTIRNEKYPPAMKCAGSIFKNFLLAELPPEVVADIPPKVIREGKVPSAYFLEQVDAKGMSLGDIQVAVYHANLIYNVGTGTARDLRTIVAELKRRVADQFGITLEEEVQYVGFHAENLAR